MSDALEILGSRILAFCTQVSESLLYIFCFSLLSFICKHSKKIIALEDQISCNESAEGLGEVSKNIKHTFLPLLLSSGSHAAASSGVLPVASPLFLSPSPVLSFLLGTARGETHSSLPFLNSFKDLPLCCCSQLPSSPLTLLKKYHKGSAASSPHMRY